MKNLFAVLTIAAVLLAGNAFAQDSLQVQNKKQYRKGSKGQSQMQFKGNGLHGLGFVDANGDGYNDNAPDADGDGIPNGQDPDYTGAKSRMGNSGKGFVDADGDGINDNALDADGDGIPNGQDPDYVRPQDGSGSKNKSGKGKGMRGAGNGSGLGTGGGDCDGTGPKGKRGRK